MKKSLFVGLVLLLTGLSALRAQENYEVKNSNNNSLRLTLTSGELQVKEVEFCGDTFNTLSINGFLPSSEVGKPNLPVLCKMIEIPVGSHPTVTINNIQQKVIDGNALKISHKIMPAQPSRRKSDITPDVLHIDNATYSTNQFYALPSVNVEVAGIARSMNLANLYFSPIQYNPVTNQLIVYTSVDVTITFENGDLGETQRLKSIHASHAFGTGISTINQLPATKDIVNEAPVRYTIISHSSFRDQFEDFVAWKKKKGFMVDVHYTDEAEVGTTTTTIANFLKSQYTNATAENPAPTYVLLIGDVAQIPSFTGKSTSLQSYFNNGHITDLYYFTWTSGDVIPDCYYGRFSATNLSQLTPQIEKTLMYEQYTFPDPTFLDKGVLVAGVDQGYASDYGYNYADPAMDYIANNYLNSNYGYTQVKYYKNKYSSTINDPVVTVSSNAISQAVRADFNEGAGWVNYSAHGQITEWSIPVFNTSHVNSMSNTKKFGVMIGNCCLSNSFQETCLGEALLRKGDYKGAVGYIGASDYSYWDQDFYWAVGVRSGISSSATFNYDATRLGCYDRLFHTHNEAYSKWYTTLGGVMMAGNMAVQESSGNTFKQYYWEVYHLMGDPSVMPWLTQAHDLPFTGNTTIPFGGNTVSITTAPHAYAAITDHGELIAAAFANENGDVNLNISSVPGPGVYDLVITAQNYKPLMQEITVVASDGPYLIVSSCQPDRNLSNGDTVCFNINVKNIGNQPAHNARVLVRSLNGHLLMLQPSTTVESILSDEEISLNGFFHGKVFTNTIHNEILPLNVTAQWGEGEDARAERQFNFSAKAPKLVHKSHTVEGTIAPGNDITIKISTGNNGAKDINNLTAALIPAHPSITVSNAPAITSISSGSYINPSYTIHLDANTPEDSPIPLYYTIGNDYQSITDTILLPLGSGVMEDFETGDFNKLNWTKSSANAWTIVNTNQYNGNYCARSASGWNNASCDLEIEWTSISDDSISYFRRVSSEANYDYFKFYIDGNEMEAISGTSGSWNRSAFFVPQGTHTFKFSYEKDGSVANGSDCVWLDDITLPIAGISADYSLDTVCKGETLAFHSLTINTANLELGNHYFADSTDNSKFYLLLTVSPVPTVTVSANKTNITLGESALLTANGAQSYLWSTGEDVDQIRCYPTQETQYTVTGSNNGCKASASITISTNAPREGIDAVEESIAIYPNPATDHLFIHCHTAQTAVVYNMMGQQVMVLNLQAGENTVQLSALETGSYVINTENGSFRFVKK